jgi:hypothetical protein
MTFLEKYHLVRKSVPIPALDIDQYTVNSEYADHAYSSKNCFWAFDPYWSEDNLYTDYTWGNKLVDCKNVLESDKCYECISCNHCSASTFLSDCNNCNNCHFSAFLNSCTDCFGCVALTHKKYCIFNKQYTKEEYFKKIAELKEEKPAVIMDRMLELKKQLPHPASIQGNVINSPYGDYIYDSKDCYWGFNLVYAVNSGYCYDSGFSKNCWDTFITGGSKKGKESVNCYEVIDVVDSYNCAFLNASKSCSSCYYSEYLRNCTDCFGCVGLTNKKYCILNNQLTKDQYEKAVVQIKKELGWKV